MMLVSFLALPVAQQLTLLTSQGQALPTRWEEDYYVQSYYLPTSLLVEVYYYIHSGLLYHVRARPNHS